MDLYVSCRIEKFLTNEKGTLLVLDTGQTKFLISGMLTTETLLPLEPNLTDVKSIGKTNAADRGRDFLVTEKSFDTFGLPLEKKMVSTM